MSVVIVGIQTRSNETYIKVLRQGFYIRNIFRRVAIPLVTVTRNFVYYFLEVTTTRIENFIFAIGVTQLSFFAGEIVSDKINSQSERGFAGNVVRCSDKVVSDQETYVLTEGRVVGCEVA